MNQQNSYNAIISVPKNKYLRKLFIRFAVIDTIEVLHKQIFKKYKIKFLRTLELEDNTHEYCIIKGAILFPNLTNIEKALEDLENSALICGHPDYNEVCLETIETLVPEVATPKHNNEDTNTTKGETQNADK